MHWWVSAWVRRCWGVWLCVCVAGGWLVSGWCGRAGEWLVWVGWLVAWVSEWVDGVSNWLGGVMVGWVAGGWVEAWVGWVAAWVNE